MHGHVEQALVGHGALHVHAEAVEAHAVTHAEGPRREQHHAGDHVAEGLLGGQAEHPRGEARAGRQRAGVQAGQPQAHERPDDHGAQAQNEAHDAGGAGGEAAVELRLQQPADVHRKRPAEHHQQGRDADLHRLVDPEELLAIDIGRHERGHQGNDHHELAAPTAGSLFVLGGLRRRS